MNIIPYGETIFVLPDETVGKTKSGLILTDYSKKRPTSGTILAIGNKVNNETLKIGQRIIYGEFSGHKQIINWNGEDKEIFIMTPEDILALLG